MPPLSKPDHLIVQSSDTRVVMITDQVTRMPGQKLPTRVRLSTEMSPAAAEKLADELLRAAADVRACSRVRAHLDAVLPPAARSRA